MTNDFSLSGLRAVRSLPTGHYFSISLKKNLFGSVYK
jgi:hypothetical protein